MFGVEYNSNHLIDVLKERFNLSWQKPHRVARERDEKKRKAWLETTWTETKKRAIDRRWTVAFIDESGFSPIPLVRKVWATRGQTPTLVHNLGNREKVSAISAITSDRRLYFRFKQYAAFSGEDVRRFVVLLLRHIRGRLVIIWDNAQQHHAKLVTELTRKYRRLRIEFLPGYSPDFNPDEGVWNHTKRVELGNFAPHDKDELVAGARGALRRLKRRPGKIAEFWRQSELPLRGMEALLNIPGHR